MSRNKYIMTEDALMGTIIAPATNTGGLRIADDPADPILGVLAEDVDEGEPARPYLANDGSGAVLARAGATISNTDRGKPWTTDAQGRVVLLTSTGYAGGTIDGTGQVGGLVRVFVCPAFTTITPS